MSTSGGTRQSSNARGGRGGAALKPSAAERNAAEIAALHVASAKWQADNHATPESKPGTPLEAITRIPGYRADPFSLPDPAFLTRLWGEHQLANALNYYRVEKLRETAKNQGITNFSGGRAALLSRLTAAATHGHYSADFGGAKAKTANTPEARHAARISKIDAQIARLQAQREALVRQGPQASTPPRSSTRLPPNVDLKAIALIPSHFANPGAPPDAQFLRALYGDSQLRTALGRYTLPRLREAAGLLRERNGDAGPRNAANRVALINNIYNYVTQEPYEATLQRAGGRPLGVR
jgi:hypothetical protein